MMVCLCGLTGCSGQNSDAAKKQSDAAKPGNTAAPQPAEAATNQPDFPSLTADQWIALSGTYHQQGKYLDAVGAAQSALYLRPDYAEAYNNIGAAYASLKMWDPAIQAAQQALRIKPDFPLARNNLAWALEQKRIGAK